MNHQRKTHGVLFLSATFGTLLLVSGLTAFRSAADVTLEATLTPTVIVNGLLRSAQQIEYSTNLADANGWKLLSVVRLDTTPKIFFDATAKGEQRFYRTKMIGVADTNLVWIPPGTFLMGSPSNESTRQPNEGPQTPVTLTEGFLMGRYEVRYHEMAAYVTNYSPSINLNLISDLTQYPAFTVSWNQATNYCALRTTYERAQGMIPPDWAYRLPTEAEWEYACRAGTTTPFHYGNELRNDGIRSDAWFLGAFPYPTNLVASGAITPLVATNVGSFLPNPFGLYDMYGNQPEWCLDLYPAASVLVSPQFAYPGVAVTNPVAVFVPGNPSFAMLRGGGFYSKGEDCRSARRQLKAVTTGDDIGFRVVLSPTNSPVLP
ncbi:MAG TPA: formylglycine-generating enzyme family protein [Candidatus Paceibacterota bacterium]|nr:formylglycine-generating enzyme family protein [Candidatus Paceibacterota bacterium]